MATKTLDLTIVQGKTFTLPIRWEEKPIVYKAITNITRTAPAVITAATHGLVNGWRCAVVSVKGMTEINAEDPNKLRDSDYHEATVIDADTVELNDINAADFRAYASGGYLQYNTPVDLAGFTARMSIKDKKGGTELFRLDSTNARIVIDNVAKTITLTISATDTAALTWLRGVYDLEMVSGTGVVTAILTGNVAVSREVTTT